MIRPRLPVIPSAARNLKSITARPDSQCRASIVTKSENSVRTLYVGRAIAFGVSRNNVNRHSGKGRSPEGWVGRLSQRWLSEMRLPCLCWPYVLTDTLDSSTPLRFAQNDRAGLLSGQWRAVR